MNAMTRAVVSSSWRKGDHGTVEDVIAPTKSLKVSPLRRTAPKVLPALKKTPSSWRSLDSMSSIEELITNTPLSQSTPVFSRADQRKHKQLVNISKWRSGDSNGVNLGSDELQNLRQSAKIGKSDSRWRSGETKCIKLGSSELENHIRNHRQLLLNEPRFVSMKAHKMRNLDKEIASKTCVVGSRFLADHIAHSRLSPSRGVRTQVQVGSSVMPLGSVQMQSRYKRATEGPRDKKEQFGLGHKFTNQFLTSKDGSIAQPSMTWHDRKHSEEFTNEHSIVNDRNHYWRDSSGRRPHGRVPERLAAIGSSTATHDSTSNDKSNRLSIEWSANASRRMSTRHSILNPQADTSVSPERERGCWRYTSKYNFDQIGKAMLRSAFL